MTLDFTLEKYAQLCNAILSYPIMSVRQFLEAEQPCEDVIILRHDVDRSLASAIRMARLEAGLGIQGTYYLRTNCVISRSLEVRHLRDLGHEVGYHYEVLSKAKGDMERAILLFQQELSYLRQIVDVNTISMHGSPLSPWNNLDLWQTYTFEDYGIVGDAVLSLGIRDLYYFTDTGRSWSIGRYNLRDHVSSRKLPRQIRTTDDLIGFLREGASCSVYINTHPNRWASNWFAWGVSAVSDWMINRAKGSISLMRSLGIDAATMV